MLSPVFRGESRTQKLQIYTIIRLVDDTSLWRSEMKKCPILGLFCNIINKYRFIWFPVTLTVIIYVLLLFIVYHFIILNNPLSSTSIISQSFPGYNKLEALYYASYIILTFILVCVAWVQLSRLHSISQSDFTLRILNELNGESVLNALRIIHELRLEAEKENGDKSDKNSSTIARKIRNMRDDNSKIKKFIYLKISLDYLEHISYLCNRGQISLEDIKGCIGEPIIDYYNFYQDLIVYYKSRSQNKEPPPYKETGDLITKIQENG